MNDHIKPKKTCQYCGVALLSSRHKSHETVCSGKEERSCQICGLVVKSKLVLMKHLRTHDSKQATYPCTVCGKVFSREDNLKIHMRIHTGEKPFVCSVCGEKFRVKCSLQAHESSVHGKTKEVSLKKPEGIKRRSIGQLNEGHGNFGFM